MTLNDTDPSHLQLPFLGGGSQHNGSLGLGRFDVAQGWPRPGSPIYHRDRGETGVRADVGAQIALPCMVGAPKGEKGPQRTPRGPQGDPKHPKRTPKGTAGIAMSAQRAMITFPVRRPVVRS